MTYRGFITDAIRLMELAVERLGLYNSDDKDNKEESSINSREYGPLSMDHPQAAAAAVSVLSWGRAVLQEAVTRNLLPQQVRGFLDCVILH
jgi:hypothetical protein